MKRWPAFILLSVCALSIAQTQTYSSSVDMSQYTQIAGTPARVQAPESEPTTGFNEIITLGLGEGPHGYVGVSRGAIAQLKELQSQHDESLASEDVIKTLGTPQSEIPQGIASCKEGGTGEHKTFFYLIKEGRHPIFMAILPFCNDGLQSVSIQRIP